MNDDERRAVISLLARWYYVTEDSTDEGIQRLRRETEEAVKALRAQK